MNHRFGATIRSKLSQGAHPFSHRRSRSHALMKKRLRIVLVVLGFMLAAYVAWLLVHMNTESTERVTQPIRSVTPAVAEYTPPEQTDPRFAKKPTWSQDFGGYTTSLDTKYWNVLVGPAENSNKEQQYYTDDTDNLRIEDGALRLIATKKDYPEGYKYGSARLETQGKKAFKYGRIDITTKLPTGSGTWPAVWLLPDNDVYAKKSPDDYPLRYKNGGEIDIIEAVGFEADTVYGVAHTASDVTKRSDGTGSHKSVKVKSSEYNTYTLFWTPDSLTYAVNGTPFFSYTKKENADYTTWPFDQPFYLIANLAMGGVWGGLDTNRFPGNGIDDSALPASLDIRSIHYYPYVNG